MKKGKSRNKRKKTRSRLLWIAIAVIGIAAVISAVCVAGMLATKENVWRTPEELLVEYMEIYERLITGNPEYEFIGVFADQGISGYCENRPQFQRMMEKARAGEIDLIITKSISRFARNTVTVLKFARKLKELGVGIFLKNRTLTLYQGTVR